MWVGKYSPRKTSAFSSFYVEGRVDGWMADHFCGPISNQFTERLQGFEKNGKVANVHLDIFCTSLKFKGAFGMSLFFMEYNLINLTLLKDRHVGFFQEFSCPGNKWQWLT